MSNLITGAKVKTGPKPMPRCTCSVDGCESVADHPVSGLCHMHCKRIKRTGVAETSKRLRGTGTVTVNGYIAVAKDGKKKQEHVLIVEAILGHELPKGAEIHHWDGNRANNANTNLLVCPSKAYHKMIHTRQDALAACGYASYRKCPFCKDHSDPDSMTHNKSSRYFYHQACKSAYVKSRSQS